jgi:Fe2+ or Zn2+ uptake regulation protein
MRNILKENGLIATPARVAILEIISKSKVPLSAEHISNKLKKENKSINEATIYRTLSSLAEADILRKINSRKESIYFELAQEHHHHIICLTCDTVEDFESKAVEKILGGIARNSSKFTNIKDHSLELFGLCKSCYK